MNEFDLTRYTRASKKLDLSGIDFSQVANFPISEAEVKVLTYMMDIETQTVIYLRDLLSTPAAEDPEITAFLSMWVYEEYWHGEALAAFLRAAGVPVSPARPAQNRPPLGVGKLAGGFAKAAVARMLPEFIAVHMTWGAINELSTLNGYQRVIAQTRNPVLVELLSRIIKDERRHYAFYYGQARRRLFDDARAQKITRWTLDKFWAPVGTGVRPQHETDFVVLSLFDSPEGMESIREMESEIGKLGGLEGFRLISRAMNRARSRAGSQSGRALARFPMAATFG
ncbi:MAG: ferritin-like domain-containing protein [Actinomycetota bacterium]